MQQKKRGKSIIEQIYKLTVTVPAPEYKKRVGFPKETFSVGVHRRKLS